MTEPADLQERLRSALAGQYDLERELGAGGMAIVYLARDVKHDREVALKVFRPELASSLGAERFLREIQIAAKLSHPHILPLYDSGDAGGFLYYTMPFVEGESLGDRMEREKMLPYDDALQITREVADALNYAHARGLVHRDIKPDNIMLTGGHAVVMDFGIARALSAAGGDKLTQTGMAVGTPLYMSPEQAVAVEEVDGRSDIYALGCVLYEMLTGVAPFTGPTPQAVMARHTIDQVPSPVTLRDTISPELEEIIYCALAKSPADRFRTSGEFGEALKVIQTGSGSMPRMSVSMVRPSRMTRTTVTTPLPFSPRRMTKGRTVAAASVAVLLAGAAIYQFGVRSPSSTSLSVDGPDPSRVAVLYFQDLTPDSSMGHVADGLTEGLIDQLSDVRGLDVVSANGVGQFRGTGVELDSISRALEAGSLIEGTVEAVGDGLRLSARLIDGASGVDLERTSFTMPAGELLAVRDSVVQEVARLLRRRLGDEVRTRERRRETESAEAWLQVARGERLRKEGEALWHDSEVERSRATLDRADSAFALAEQADPRWVEPIVLRAELTYLRAMMAGSETQADEWVDRGLAHAARALAVQPDTPRALAIRGALRFSSWYYGPDPEPAETKRLLDGARADLEAATEADPSLASAFEWLSQVTYIQGDLVSANLSALRAMDADAYLQNADADIYRLFQTSYDIENFGEGKRWCDEGERRFPDDPRFAQCQLWMQTARGVEPDPDEAWRQLKRLEQLTPAPQWPLWKLRGRMLVAGSLARAGLEDSARSLLVSSRGDPEVDPGRSLLTTEAFIRENLLGDRDEALRLLQTYMLSNPHHRHESTETVHWWWRRLQDDPRYQALLRSGG